MAGDDDEGVDFGYLFFLHIFDQKAIPGILRDFPHAVDELGPKEKPEVLGEHPDNARHAPGQKIEDCGGFAPAQLVGNYAPKKPETNLRQHSDRSQQTDVCVLDAERQHVHRRVGKTETYGKPPHGFCIHASARISAKADQGPD